MLADTSSHRRNFGLRLGRLIEARGWSEGYVAEKIGTKAASVNKWRRGKSDPCFYFVIQLSDLFGVSLGHLAGEE